MKQAQFLKASPSCFLLNLGLSCLLLLFSSLPALSAEDYAQWNYYRTMTVNTSLSGANVSAAQRNFPTLIRLNASNFDFTKAHRAGADLRFAKTNGARLPYQIEQWDSAGRSAAVWVLLDTVPGNSTRTFRMHYGKAGAADSSMGPAVFDTANGFQGVFHLAEAANDTIRDATINRFKGVPRNRGGQNPRDTTGLLGRAKNFLGSNVNDNGGSYRLVTSNGSNT